MTTVAASTRSTTYTLASASAGPFLVGFRIFDSTLTVYVNGSLRTDYTMSATYSGGYCDTASITFTSDLAEDDILQIDGAMPISRAAEYLSSDPNLTKKINIEQGRQWAAMQQLKRDVSAFPVYSGVPYGSRAEAEAATVPAAAMAISVVHDNHVLNYRRDADGTALTTNGGTAKWSPAVVATLAHWGGVSDGADTLDGWLVIRGGWVTTTSYAVGDLVWQSSIGYRCLTAHTAGTFATDLAAGKWIAGEFSGTDNTAAFLAALTWLDGDDLHLASGGMYRFAHQALANAGYVDVSDINNISIIGNGAWLLIDEDPTYYDGSSGDKQLVFLIDSGVSSDGDRYAKGRAVFKDVFWRGRWSHNNAKTGVNAVRTEGWSYVEFNGGGASDIRNKITRCKSNGAFKVINTFSQRCARGFWRSQDTDKFYAVGNIVIDGDDDAFDAHSSDTSLGLPARSEVYICDNILRNCEGIVALGAKVATIKGNKLRLTHGSGIAVGSGIDPEGNTAAIMIDVSGNHVLDPLERYDTGAFTASNVNQGGIYVAGTKKSSASTSGDLPGGYDGSSAFLPPYTDAGTTPSWGAMWAGDTYDEGADATVYSSPGGMGFTVAENQVRRTLPDLAAFSDAGIGLYFHGTDGYIDPAVTSAAYKANSIILLGDMTDFVVTGNIGSGLPNAGLWLRGASALERKLAFRNGHVHGNLFSDSKYGIGKDTPGGTPAFADYDDWTITFANNRIDVDPYHTADIRTSPLDGTWQSSSALTFIGILFRYCKGATFIANDFSNCYRPIQGNNSEQDQFVLRDNIVRCNPAATVWNAANVGVGVPENAAYGYTHIIEDGNPANATYGKVLNTCPTGASAVPSAGTFVQGHFIWETNPAVSSSKVTLGWKRLTTGTGHTVATTGPSGDWAPVVATTS